MTDTLTALRADYEALGKRIAELEKKPEPCPLEAGKPVSVWMRKVPVTLEDCSVEVQKDDRAYGYKVVIVSSGWDKERAFERADEIIKACGGSSD